MPSPRAVPRPGTEGRDEVQDGIEQGPKGEVERDVD